jgi:hypothetical protein
LFNLIKKKKMTEIKKSVESKDYKERFEFELTVGNNIICQRFFRINNFNPVSLQSYELTDAIRRCVAIIDRDLKDKTHAYLEIYAPKVFNSIEDMSAFVNNPNNKRVLTLGEGLVVRNNSVTDYVYTNKGDGYEALGYKFDDGELTSNTSDDNKTTYKFAFKVDGREVCSVIWDGYYPKFVRDKIDLSNKRGKFESEDLSRLSFEQYLLHKMVSGKSDLVYGLIRNICQACSVANDKSYTTSVDEIMYGWNVTSHNNIFRLY